MADPDQIQATHYPIKLKIHKLQTLRYPDSNGIEKHHLIL